MAAWPGTGNARQARSKGLFINVSMSLCIMNAERKHRLEGEELQTASCPPSFSYPWCDGMNGAGCGPLFGLSLLALGNLLCGAGTWGQETLQEKSKGPLSRGHPQSCKVSLSLWSYTQPPLQGMSPLVRKEWGQTLPVMSLSQGWTPFTTANESKDHFPKKRKSSLNYCKESITKTKDTLSSVWWHWGQTQWFLEPFLSKKTNQQLSSIQEPIRHFQGVRRCHLCLEMTSSVHFPGA